jgi:hypothetical protein
MTIVAALQFPLNLKQVFFQIQIEPSRGRFETLPFLSLSGGIQQILKSDYLFK